MGVLQISSEYFLLALAVTDEGSWEWSIIADAKMRPRLPPIAKGAPTDIFWLEGIPSHERCPSNWVNWLGPNVEGIIPSVLKFNLAEFPKLPCCQLASLLSLAALGSGALESCRSLWFTPNSAKMSVRQTLQ